MVEVTPDELAQLDQDDSDDRDDHGEFEAVLKLCEQEQETMSRQEMIQIIEKQRSEIKYLKEKLRLNEFEKEQIIENFQVSTSVLLDRLKDFEAERHAVEGERPQTASVLSKLGKCKIFLNVCSC